MESPQFDAVTVMGESMPSLSSMTAVGCFILMTVTIIYATGEDLESHIVQSHTTSRGETVVVLDDLFPESSLEALQTLILSNSPWQLHNELELTQSAPIKRGKGDSDEDESGCSTERVPWSVPIPTAVFTQFNIWRILQNCLKHVTDRADYQPYEITVQVLQRGDKVNTTCGQEASSGEDRIIRLFLTQDWRQNDYGDLTLFTKEDDDIDSVLLNVKPMFGRVVVWDARIPYLSHSPSMNYVQELIFLTIKCTRDMEKVKVTQKEVGTKLIERENSQFFRFPKFKKKPNSQKLSEKEVRRFHDKAGKVAVVFDNLFSNDDVSNLKMYATEQGPYFSWASYDSSIEEGGDNVKWIKGFEPEDFIHTQWWPVIAELVKYVSGKKAGWYPYNVALNVGKPTDHVRIHADCELWEDEYTFLMYLNSNWSADNLGETTFFDTLPEDEDLLEEEFTAEEIYQMSEYDAIGAVRPQQGRVVVFQGKLGETTFFDTLPEDDDLLEEEFTAEEIYQMSEYDAIGAVRPQQGRVVVFQGKLGETTFFDTLPEDDDLLEEEFTAEEIYQMSEYDAIGAVRPQQGRVVVFQGTIPHSARPPANSYQGIRLSFAVKVAATKQFAIAKRLREAIEDYPGETTDDEEMLIEELYDCSINKDFQRTEKWLMEQLNEYIVKREEFIESRVKQAKSHLMKP